MTVEDGSGLPTADSYADVAFCDAYHVTRGNAAWGLLDNTLKEQAIVRATDAIDARFRRRLPGDRASSIQALEWPRLGAFDVQGRPLVDERFHMPLSSREGGDFGVLSGVPRALKCAVAEAALLEAQKPGVLKPSLSRGGQVASESFRGISTTFAPGAPVDVVHTGILGHMNAILINGGEVSY